MICFYNGKILRRKINVKYVGNKVVIVPLDVPIDAIDEYTLYSFYPYVLLIFLVVLLYK